MRNTEFNQHWYRVAELKPRLQSHIDIHRHDYRGLIWYIIEDTATGRNHRFNPAAYQFIGLLDGKLTVQEILDALNMQLGDAAPSQEDIIQLLSQLHSADLIQTDVLINTEALFERQTHLSRTNLNQRWLNPISQKLPLWDPDSFLNKHLDKVRWMFSAWMAVAWILIVGFSSLQAAANWVKITSHFELNALSPYNFLMLFLLYPPIKILHELGHGFATKLKGGEVHEMGINFLMFMPVPYVNVSSSAHFRSKYDRMLVSAAGILVESFIAALGLLLFLSAETGAVKNLGFDILLTGGVSSLLFNGNPLLKYDGYYFLADALGIPNLYQRSAQYWRYFFQRHLFGLRRAASPATAPGETFWFIVYSIASLLYRLSILWFICVYVTSKFFALGIVIALWLVATQILLPLWLTIRFVVSSPSLVNNRNRAAITTVALGFVVVGLFCFMPIPSYTLTEGVVWLPDEAQIKVEQDGFIGNLKVASNQLVHKGNVVLQLTDDALESKTRIARAKLIELQGRYRAERGADLVKADIFKAELHVAQSELDFFNNKMRTMTINAAKSGQLLLPEADDLPGRFVRHGELIGYILDEKPPVIRMVVTQDNIGRLRECIADIKVRLANAPGQEYDATILRQAPEATNKLPSPALATTGGGKITVDPNSEKGLVEFQKVFLVDLKFNPIDKNIPIGTRVFVRINHGGEALSVQWYRRIRQVFLRQFNV
jgi:putative peptide zinc metalloprotease protein